MTDNNDDSIVTFTVYVNDRMVSFRSTRDSDFMTAYDHHLDALVASLQTIHALGLEYDRTDSTEFTEGYMDEIVTIVTR